MAKATLSKFEQVKAHLIKKGSITSWEAINLYRATRLSAIIFELRGFGYLICSERILTPDGHFVKYVYQKNK